MRELWVRRLKYELLVETLAEATLLAREFMGDKVREENHQRRCLLLSQMAASGKDAADMYSSLGERAASKFLNFYK